MVAEVFGKIGSDLGASLSELLARQAFYYLLGRKEHSNSSTHTLGVNRGAAPTTLLHSSILPVTPSRLRTRHLQHVGNHEPAGKNGKHHCISTSMSS